MKPTFITGNQSKADYLAKYLGLPIEHQKVDLEEIQSLDLREVVELEFKALGRLPGTFIRFYVDEVPFEIICRTLDGLSRDATARCMFAYYDGTDMHVFEGHMDGRIADHPAGNNGFGWDRIFIPDGYTTTRASVNDDDYQTIYAIIKPIAKLKEFLERS